MVAPQPALVLTCVFHLHDGNEQPTSDNEDHFLRKNRPSGFVPGRQWKGSSTDLFVNNLCEILKQCGHAG